MITWISAPAGFGKTNLVSSYLQSSSNHVLWYRVDSGDADIATIFLYLGQAARKTAPRKCNNGNRNIHDFVHGIVLVKQ